MGNKQTNKVDEANIRKKKKPQTTLPSENSDQTWSDALTTFSAIK